MLSYQEFSRRANLLRYLGVEDFVKHGAEAVVGQFEIQSVSSRRSIQSGQEWVMSKRSRTDPILLAKKVFDHIEAQDRPKNPAAVAMGKLGGPKGGPARAKALSPERRKEIAQKAAMARWKKGKRDNL